MINKAGFQTASQPAHQVSGEENIQKTPPPSKTKRARLDKTPGLHIEQSLWQRGFKFIAGIDEAGRGAWAGPVMAAAVILPDDAQIAQTLWGVRDSKQMTGLQRDHWAQKIKSLAITWWVGAASPAEIDKIGILPCNRLAMARAIDGLALAPEYHLFDFIHWKDCPFPGEKLIRGETQSLSIAAASVLAKTARDEVMILMNTLYPGYSFARHKGYGTAIHREALHHLGLCEIHRQSFAIPRKSP